MNHITIGGVEVAAAGVGLVTGLLYGGLRLPIPAPNVLGGVFAIWGTFIGLCAVQLVQGQLTFF